MAEVADGRAIDGAWLARPDAAAALGVTVDVLDKRFREHAGGKGGPCERGGRHNLTLYVRGLVEAWVNYRVEEALAPVRADLEAARRDAAGGDLDAALLAGERTPALERLQTARAGIAELDLAQKRGDLVDRRDFQALLQRVAHIMRGCGDALQRAYGADAQNVLDEGITEVLREIDRHFATYDDDGEQGTGIEGTGTAKTT